LAPLPNTASDFEVCTAAENAIEAVRQRVNSRQMTERVIKRAVSLLTFLQSTEQHKARVRWERAEILADLPHDVTEAEAKVALQPTVREACQEMDDRQAHKRREEQKARLIQYGLAEISGYPWRLNQDGEITAEEYLDADFKAGLQRTVKAELERALSGEETTKEVEELAREIIEAELG